MNKALFIITSIIISTSLFSQDIESNKQKNPLFIDGKDDDWGEKPCLFNSETSILYEIRNDDENLYIIMEVIDSRSQMKFMGAGFQILISAKTKPKLNAQVDFLPQKPENGMRGNDKHNEYILKSTHADIEGFLVTQGVIKRNTEVNESFTYNIGWNDNQNMLIEIKIPANEMFAEVKNFNDTKETPLNIIFKLKAMKRPSQEEMMARREAGGGRPSMGGGMSGEGGRPSMGGGMGGSPMGGGRHQAGASQGGHGDMGTMFSEQSYKIKFILGSK